VWQFDGQCCKINSHDRAEGGSVPSWVSVALPEKLITSPTFQVVPAAGVLITAVGGVFPTVIVTDAVADALLLSVTLSVAV
jgi:hypothetical protein